jgi:Cu(I)/Ag(I) efflux system membrane fusion protein
MKQRSQILVAAGLIVAALAAVAAFTIAGRDRDAAVPGVAAEAAPAGQLNPVSIDSVSARRIGIAYAVAETGPLSRTVRTVGSVAYDETRVVTVSPQFEGWAERLFVDFTGAPVRRGQPLLAAYSPMLVAAQEELILAAQLARDAVGETASRNASDLLDAARRRLASWGVAAEQIAHIEADGAPRRTVTLYAPAAGIVVEKSVVAGSRIMPGMDLYRIADLSVVWVEGEVFEKDLGLVQVGREAAITFEAYPGEVFGGRVTWVHPTVSPETRTGRIRIELSNPALRLKPGMYANVEFDVPVHVEGLHVPRTAVLTTGTRALVFVRHEDGSLVPHEVTTGRAAGDHIEILAGLEAGQVVVASAGFLVDAEANLGAALRSMPESASPPAAAPAHRH